MHLWLFIKKSGESIGCFEISRSGMERSDDQKIEELAETYLLRRTQGFETLKS